jgi:putative multiple sugar transport system substrate-binding protein
MLLLALAGCNPGGKTKTIGIIMPSRNDSRWQQDSDNLMRQLQSKGYEVDIKNSGDDAELQIRQSEDMINNNVDVLVIAAHDSTKLVDVLQKAANKKITVIAYDRLLMDTPNVDYYVTFDNFGVGVLQGEYIEDMLDLKNAAGPFNIELFAGPPTDNNTVFFYNGALEILRPYIDSGKLVVRSGQLERADVSTQEWSLQQVEERIRMLLDRYYLDGEQLDAILSPNDWYALEIIRILKEYGYGAWQKTFPYITGQDSDIAGVKAILDGELGMTVFKDTRSLADRTFLMIDDILLKKTPETNDETTYNNNVKTLKTYICRPVKVTKDNYKSVLIDSGYYDMSDFQ